MKTDLLKFYRNESKNNRGVALSDIWNYNDTKLEKDHHFIQWLFPTDQKSGFNWSAPVLNCDDMMILKNDQGVMCNFKKSLKIFLLLYGLLLKEDDLVSLADDFEERAKNWITPNNHNYKRISRILRFLTLFEFYDIKRNLLDILDAIYFEHRNIIGETTYNIWKSV